MKIRRNRISILILLTVVGTGVFWFTRTAYRDAQGTTISSLHPSLTGIRQANKQPEGNGAGSGADQIDGFNKDLFRDLDSIATIDLAITIELEKLEAKRAVLLYSNTDQNEFSANFLITRPSAAEVKLQESLVANALEAAAKVADESTVLGFERLLKKKLYEFQPLSDRQVVAVRVPKDESERIQHIVGYLPAGESLEKYKARPIGLMDLEGDRSIVKPANDLKMWRYGALVPFEVNKSASTTQDKK